MSLSDTTVRRALQAARRQAELFVDALMIHETVITRPTEGSIDADTTLSFIAGTPIYSGKAKFGPARGPVTYTIGDEVQFFSSSSVSIPQQVSGTPVEIRVDDVLQVTGHDDPAWVGLYFRVVDVEAAGLLGAARKLQLVGVQRHSSWVDAAVRHPSTVIPGQIPPEWRLE